MGFDEMPKNNPSLQTIYIHVGLPKTATTSIQYTLYENRLALEQLGIHYLNRLEPHHNSLCSVFNPNNRQDFMNLYRNKGRFRIGLEDLLVSRILREEVLECLQPSLVISGEALCFQSEETLRRLRSFLKDLAPNARIVSVISLRKHESFYVSLIQESVCNGFARPFVPWSFPCVLRSDEYIPDILWGDLLAIRMKDILRKLWTVFGQSNTLHYSFEQAIKNKFGPAGHFLEVIGLESKQIQEINILQKHEGRSNQALHIHTFLEEFCPRFLDGKYNWWRVPLDTTPILGINGDKWNCTDTVKEKWFMRCGDDIAWLKREAAIDYDYYEKSEYTVVPGEFDENFYNDVTRVFHLFNPAMHAIMYCYAVEAQKYNPQQKNIFFLLQQWIIQHYPRASQGIKRSAGSFAAYRMLAPVKRFLGKKE